MSKKIIILQYFGLGDILFIEPIYRWFHEKGYEVIAPVHDHYFWISEYIPYVNFKKTTDFKMNYEQFGFKDHEDCEVIPLRFATPLQRGSDPYSGNYKEYFMLDKYRLLGLSADKWKELKWERKFNKEDALYKSLGLQEDSEYTFVNSSFGDQFEQVNMPVFSSSTIYIYMKKIPGYSMLDWAKVIINAKEIHTVETSVIYMFQALPLKAKEIHIYPRVPYEGVCIGIKEFAPENWILHEVAL